MEERRLEERGDRCWAKGGCGVWRQKQPSPLPCEAAPLFLIPSPPPPRPTVPTRCGEMLWIDLFIIVSEFVALGALGETCVVLALSFYTEEYLLPPWMSHLSYSVFKRCSRWRRGGVGVGAELVSTTQGQGGSAWERLDARSHDAESSAGLYWRTYHSGPSAGPPATLPAPPTVASLGPHAAELDEVGLAKREAAQAKLILYERMFFLIDQGAQGQISIEDAARFLSFAAVEIRPEERRELVKAADTTSDGALVRWEFVQLCARTLWNVPVETLEMAQQNYADAQSFFERRNSHRWKVRTPKRNGRSCRPPSSPCGVAGCVHGDFCRRHSPQQPLDPLSSPPPLSSPTTHLPTCPAPLCAAHTAERLLPRRCSADTREANRHVHAHCYAGGVPHLRNRHVQPRLWRLLCRRGGGNVRGAR